MVFLVEGRTSTHDDCQVHDRQLIRCGHQAHSVESQRTPEGEHSLEHIVWLNVGKQYGYWDRELQFHERIWDVSLKLISRHIELPWWYIDFWNCNISNTYKRAILLVTFRSVLGYRLMASRTCFLFAVSVVLWVTNHQKHVAPPCRVLFVICVISNSQCRCLTILKFYAWRIWMMISFIVQNKYFIQWISHSSVRCAFLSAAFDRLWVWNSCPLGPQVEEGWLQIHVWRGNSSALPLQILSFL